MGIVFEWDSRKAKANSRKHKVTFEEACTVFGDPLALTIMDDKHSGEEDRYVTLGVSASMRLLIVVHTDRYGNLRIISSRKATKRERKQYEEVGQEG